MNPQFTNMAGMGRGMPNMNMNMGMGNMNMMMNNNANPQMAQQKNPSFLQFIYQSLQQSSAQDGPFSGWRANVTHQDRAAQIKILFDSLRMLGQSNDIRRSLEIALVFERNQFTQSESVETYKQSIHDKLASIRDQRQQQAANNGGINNQMAANMNQMGGMPNMSAFSQPAQAAGLMQGVMPNQNNINTNAQMNAQMAMQQPVAGQANRAGVPELTKEDNSWINTRAAEMAKQTPRDQMTDIVKSMDGRVRQSLQEKKIDPIIYHFRMKATKEFRQQQAQRNGQPPQMMAGMNANMARMQSPFQNPGMPNVPQNGNPAFMQNMDYTRQQQEGLRQQEEGQMVVPASTQTPQMLMNTPFVRQRRELLLREFKQRNPGASDEMANRAIHGQVMNLIRSMQMQMNQGGVPNAMQPGPNGPAQQNLGLLQQPFNQNQSMQNDSPAQAIVRPQSTAQATPTMPNVAQQQQAAPTLQLIQQNFTQMPPQLQAILRQRPQQEWVATFVKYKMARQQQQMAAQQAAQQASKAGNMARTASQQPSVQQQQQSMPPQMVNQVSAGQTPMMPTLSGGAGQMNSMTMNQMQLQQQGNMTTQAQNMMRLQQQQQQKQQQGQIQQPAQQTPQIQQQKLGQDPSQVDALIRESDNYQVPQSFLKSFMTIYQNAGIQPPPLRTWGQLKEYTRVQGSNARVPLPKINGLQLSVVTGKQGGRPNPAGMPGQPVPQPAQAMQNNAQSAQMRQQNSGQGPAGFQPVTQQDVIAAKATNAQYAQFTNHQVQQLLEQSRAGRNMQGANVGQDNATMQAQAHARAALQQRTNQQTPVQNRPPQPNLAQPQPQSKVADNKNIKREKQEPTPAQQQAQAPMPGTISKEEFARLPPEQQAEYRLAMQKKRIELQVAQIAREITQSIKRTPPQSMDKTQREKIVKQLTDPTTKGILSRFNPFILALAAQEPDMGMVRTMMQHRWYLTQQYKDSKNYVPADQFTLTPENIESMLAQITRKFQHVQQKAAQMKNGAPGPQQPLTRENLDKVDQQQTTRKNTKPKDGPPPAPTTDKAPFTFPPGDRGQGAPTYATPGLKPEDLKLPNKKKLKTETGASPVASGGVPPQRPTIKCPVAGCTVQPQGFNTQAELDAHRAAAHSDRHVSVGDGTAFLDNALQHAFNLGDNLEKAVSKPMVKNLSQNIGTPVDMARTLSQQRASPTPPGSLKRKADGVKEKSAEDEWSEMNMSFDDFINVFGAPEGGDVIPLEADSEALLNSTLEVYKTQENYKRAFGEPDAVTSENSSSKSKSPDQGSEPSLPGQTNNNFNFTLDGNELPVLEGFDEFLKMDSDDKDWMVLDEGSVSPWEKIEAEHAKPGTADNTQNDFSLDSWIQDPDLGMEVDPAREAEMEKMINEDFDWETMYTNGDPADYAGGSLAWNAVGKTGEETRRERGWPVEGATGQKTAA